MSTIDKKASQRMVSFIVQYQEHERKICVTEEWTLGGESNK
jgi:hypothetical protein